MHPYNALVTAFSRTGLFLDTIYSTLSHENEIRKGTQTERNLKLKGKKYLFRSVVFVDWFVGLQKIL